LNFVPNESSRMKFLFTCICCRYQGKQAVTIPDGAGAAFVDTITPIKTTYKPSRRQFGPCTSQGDDNTPGAVYHITECQCQMTGMNMEGGGKHRKRI
jgi:hypothetical protein